MTSTTNSSKQRKLADLRVADLQRELRLFNIFYDKKELKGSLLEKLRQALIDRNLDPESYSFDTISDLKSMPSDENGSYGQEPSAMETSSDQALNIENSEQIHSTAAPSTTLDTNDEQINQMDTIDLRQIVDDQQNENIFSSIDQTTTKHDDEYSNDNIDHGLTQPLCSSSDEDPYIKDSADSSDATHTRTSITAAHDQHISSDSNHGGDHQLTTSLPTTNLSTDNENLSKSENKQQGSTDEQPKKSNQCHLWVSNIAKETHASDLKDLFSKHGKVLTTKVIGSSSSQWFGYITLATPDDVEKCINALHQTELHGKKIYVDREMHDQPERSSSSSKSKSHSDSISSSAHKRSSDQSNHKSSSSTTGDSFKKRDSNTNNHSKSVNTDHNVSSKKRPASTSNDNKKKLSTHDVKKSNENNISSRKPLDSNPRRTSSSSNNSQSNKQHASRSDVPRTSERIESSYKSSSGNRSNEKYPDRPERSSLDSSKTKPSSSSTSHRSRSNEKRLTSTSTKPDYHHSLSGDKSKPRTTSHSTTNKYDKSKDSFSKDTHRSASSNSYDSDRRSTHQNEQRLRHEKEILVHKQLVQQQEEEKIKEQQRRLAEERERVRREFEFLERERLEIERTRLALEKEKQDQARELDKQQRRLADEAKHRQQQAEAKLRDEKLHRIAHHDNKHPRDSQRSSHYQNSNNNNDNSSKGYDHRSSSNTSNERGRDRSLGETNRDYYSEAKRPYSNNMNNQRETMFRDRVAGRDSDISSSSSSLVLSSPSTIISSNTNNNPRYLPPSSHQNRPVDPYNALPQRGRDMALPPTSSVSTVYERSSRNNATSPTNNSALLRRPHSRERFDGREFLQQAQRRDRSPPPTSTLRREPMETAHWERPKARDSTHYSEDAHKYLSNQYLSDTSPSMQQQQPQGLWSAAPPSRAQHHHGDLSVKAPVHPPVVDPYSWQHVSSQVPPPAHDRSRTNVISNQRIPMLSSNQPPPPPPSARGNTTGQSHIYNHPGVPVSAIPTSQQHASLVPPPSLHHTTAYVAQQAPPPGLVLHPTGQARTYESHYVVTQPIQPRRY
ncbi:unnamed protein product [Adineta ricciae]|uniref:RRM domain-containing protein n=1 Tax=Adineta ricciae TaxID=249248 RepID=A0A815AYI2_ADIRI|nr:unnamed protein product [Adineta ricciae]CAF1262529.1 unnamed protein product [Adineta ricciae]